MDQMKLFDGIVSLAQGSGLSRSETNILQFLLGQEEPQNSETIAEATKVPKTKVYHFLKSLRDIRILEVLPGWPQKYKLRDLETVIVSIRQEGVRKLHKRSEAAKEKAEELTNFTKELLNMARGEWPRGIFADVINRTEDDRSVQRIYRTIIENGQRLISEYRAISPITIFQVPDRWIKHEARRRWKKLHKQRIKDGVKAKYVCYLGDIENRLENGRTDVRRIVIELRELEKNLREITTLNLCFSDRAPWGSLLIWDDRAAILLSQRKDPFEEPYQEGISIEGRAAVAILKHQYDVYFEGLVRNNLMEYLQNKGQEREQVEKFSEVEKMEYLKKTSLTRLGRVRDVAEAILARQRTTPTKE